jgi:hypothetical protein
MCTAPHAWYDVAKDFQVFAGALVAGTFAISAATIAYRAARKQAQAVLDNGRAQIGATRELAASVEIRRRNAFRRATSLELIRLSEASAAAGDLIVDRLGAIINGGANLPKPLVSVPSLLEREWEQMGTLDTKTQDDISRLIFEIEIINQQFASNRQWDRQSLMAMLDRFSNVATIAQVRAKELNPVLGTPLDT